MRKYSQGFVQLLPILVLALAIPLFVFGAWKLNFDMKSRASSSEPTPTPILIPCKSTTSCPKGSTCINGYCHLPATPTPKPTSKPKPTPTPKYLPTPLPKPTPYCIHANQAITAKNFAICCSGLKLGLDNFRIICKGPVPTLSPEPRPTDHDVVTPKPTPSYRPNPTATPFISLSITTNSFIDGQAGQPYRNFFYGEATGYSNLPILTLTTTNLPPGLSMPTELCGTSSPTNRTVSTLLAECALNGIPTTAGNYLVKVTLLDNTNHSVSKNVPIKILPIATPSMTPVPVHIGK